MTSSAHDHAANAVVPVLAASPGIQRLPTAKLMLFIQRDFLNSAECAALCALIDRERRPSTLADYNGDASFRTSETCDLSLTEPVVAAVDARLAALTGIDPALGEPMQGQRYATGQQFKQHTDYFDPRGADFARYCSVSGQRTWTAMIYLNAPEAGGATRFKAVDKIVRPEPGKLLAWNNLRADGTPNPATLHAAMPVRAGFKYVITKWYREKPHPR